MHAELKFLKTIRIVAPHQSEGSLKTCLLQFKLQEQARCIGSTCKTCSTGEKNAVYFVTDAKFRFPL